MVTSIPLSIPSTTVKETVSCWTALSSFGVVVSAAVSVRSILCSRSSAFNRSFSARSSAWESSSSSSSSPGAFVDIFFTKVSVNSDVLPDAPAISLQNSSKFNSSAPVLLALRIMLFTRSFDTLNPRIRKSTVSSSQSIVPPLSVSTSSNTSRMCSTLMPSNASNSRCFLSTLPLHLPRIFSSSLCSMAYSRTRWPTR